VDEKKRYLCFGCINNLYCNQKILYKELEEKEKKYYMINWDLVKKNYNFNGFKCKKFKNGILIKNKLSCYEKLINKFGKKIKIDKKLYIKYKIFKKKWMDSHKHIMIDINTNCESVGYYTRSICIICGQAEGRGGSW
jgi:hypothetical protein